MKPSEIFNELLTSYASRREMSAATGISKTVISHIATGKYGIGRVTRAKLENWAKNQNVTQRSVSRSSKEPS
jgi:hypothetical protein